MVRLSLLLALLGCQEYGIVGKNADVSGLEDSAGPMAVDPEVPEDTGEIEEEPPPEVPPEEPPPDEPPPEEPPPEEPPPPSEECDGEDNDGDGEIDEGFEDTDGDGIADCREVDYAIRLSITVDDVYSAWVDGEPIAFERAGWNVLEEHAVVLNSGRHVVAVHGWDTGLAISGHLSALWIDEVLHAVTGDGSWRVRADWAPVGWTEVDFDDSAWVVPVPCADVAPWSSFTPTIMELGAVWTWYAADGDCRASSSYGDAFYRLVLELPPA